MSHGKCDDLPFDESWCSLCPVAFLGKVLVVGRELGSTFWGNITQKLPGTEAYTKVM